MMNDKAMYCERGKQYYSYSYSCSYLLMLHIALLKPNRHNEMTIILLIDWILKPTPSIG